MQRYWRRGGRYADDKCQCYITTDCAGRGRTTLDQRRIIVIIYTSVMTASTDSRRQETPRTLLTGCHFVRRRDANRRVRWTAVVNVTKDLPTTQSDRCQLNTTITRVLYVVYVQQL